MEIAVLMASAGSRLGGLETAARELAEGLARLGHDVTLVTGAGPGARLQGDLRSGRVRFGVRSVPMLGQSSLPARLLSRLRGVHASVVEARTFWGAARRSPSVMGLLNGSDVVSAHLEVEAVEASRALRAPVVYYYAGPVDPRRLARGRFARLVAISRMVADYHATLAERLALPPVDAVVTPGVREEQIAPAPGPNVGSGRPEALFTGRLDAVPQKRAEKLIEWWPRVVNEVPAARLTLAGGGSDLGNLRREVRRRGLAESVSLPGPVPYSGMYERLRQASLYVFPSMLETWGIAPVEALAAGLPVVASDIEALRESLGDAALLVPPEDDEAWVRTLVRVLRDPALRLEMAARGPRRAAAFTWAAQSRLYEAQLLAAVGSGSVGPGVPPAARRRASSV
jgi:glycosyltransferase involved in cell wall biosynthesis